MFEYVLIWSRFAVEAALVLAVAWLVLHAHSHVEKLRWPERHQHTSRFAERVCEAEAEDRMAEDAHQTELADRAYQDLQDERARRRI